MTLRERRVTTRAVCGRRRWPRRGYGGRDVMMIDYVTFACGGGGGINVFTTWIRGNRCGDGHYIIIIIIYIKGLAKILWLQTNASRRARESVRLLRGPFDTRPDYLQVCVRFGFLRLYTHYYNIIYYYDGPAGENAVISSPHNAACVFVPFVLRFSLIILSNVDRAKYTMYKHIIMRTRRAFKKKNRIMSGRERRILRLLYRFVRNRTITRTRRLCGQKCAKNGVVHLIK